MSNETDNMYQVYADQYECPAVVLAGPVDADRVIEFAREIGAECAWECEPDEVPDLVIAFAYADHADPEVYTEAAVRETIEYEASRA